MKVCCPHGTRFELLVEDGDWVLGLDHLISEEEEGVPEPMVDLVALHLPCNQAEPEHASYVYPPIRENEEDDDTCFTCHTAKVPDSIKTIMMLEYEKKHL